MISIEDFKTASFEKKCDLITHFADYITFCNKADAKAYLYHSGEFFIEVHYSTLNKRVLAINAFNNSDGLEPYAEIVSLIDLVGC